MESKVRVIRRKTRRKHSAEEKVRVVLEVLRGEESIAELCRREGIALNLYYSYSKEIVETGSTTAKLRASSTALRTDVMRMAIHQYRLGTFCNRLWARTCIGNKPCLGFKSLAVRRNFMIK